MYVIAMFITIFWVYICLICMYIRLYVFTMYTYIYVQYTHIYCGLVNVTESYEDRQEHKLPENARVRS